MSLTRPLRFVRYCLLGGVNTGIHLAVVALLHDQFSVPLLLANALAFLVANLFSFLANAHWTFSSSAPWRRYPRFLMVSLWTLGISSASVVLALHAGRHYAIGVVAGALLSALAGYAASARFVYRDERTPPP